MVWYNCNAYHSIILPLLSPVAKQLSNGWNATETRGALEGYLLFKGKCVEHVQTDLYFI